MAQRMCKEGALTTITEQLEFIRATKRGWQVQFRKHLQNGTMRQDVADSKLSKIDDVEATLEKLKLLEEVSEEMKGRVAA